MPEPDDGRSAVTVSLRQLIAVGLLAPGTVLTSRPGNWADREATVLENGDLRLDGRVFNSPSAAGHHVRKGATNGWYFWSVPDGRRLTDLRKAYRASH
ncbi:restriction system modified-DNA reader domain-containing protein [Actinophytocola sediminis]